MHIHLVGFGSQGSAWAECLRASGHEVTVFLETSSRSRARATLQGFTVRATAEIPAALRADSSRCALIAVLTPDHIISPLYREFIAQAERPVTVVLAHGYAVYAGELTKLAPGHETALLAPKAIGPKLLAAFDESKPHPHRLVAAVHASPERRTDLDVLARGLGFAAEKLVPATFEQEAIGDLISEQALLCGGVFNLIEWTMKAMHDAGVPPALIREECLTELELVAGMIREHGTAATLGKISQAAQCGTIVMRRQLLRAAVPELIAIQAENITSRRFVDEMGKSEWREEIASLRARLAELESREVRRV